MLIDLHNHTLPASDDSLLRPDELIDLAKERGLDGIAITDHDWFWKEEEVLALGRRHNFLVIPAVEINTDDGHLIVFGLRRYVFGMHRATFLRAMVEAVDGAMIYAHPYRRALLADDTLQQGFQRSLERARKNPLYQIVEAVEAYNGRGMVVENLFSSHAIETFGLRGVASSDAHRPDDVAACATEFNARIECERDLIQELRAGNFRPIVLRKTATRR
ncbi:MAG: PHP domain-containing protein [Chloroflexi bacterium]|nr:PHP domain-containing protein [Chloroflexota bacterium]